MGAVPQGVLNWLYSVLTEYHDINRTYSDVVQILSQNPYFALRTEVYTYENGHSSLLLNISGTLPVNFRGNTYMFPISVWVPKEYPRATPMTFVTPTTSMVIRPGQYISAEGRVYHPYLAGWKPDRSNIKDFLSILVGVFAREPPVISRQEKAPQSQPIVQPAQGPSSNEVPPPIPPLPPELGGSNTRDSPSRSLPGFESKPPRLPPKPFTSFQSHQLQDTNAAPPLPPHPSEAVTRTMHSADPYPQSYYRTMPQVPRDTAHNFSSFQSQTLPNTPEHQNVHPHNQTPNRESYSPVSPLTPERQQTDNSSSGLNTMTAWACCQCGGVNDFHVTPGHCSICAHSYCSNCPMRPSQSLNFQQAPPPSQISFMDSRANHVHSQMNSHYSQSPQGQPSQSYLSPPQQGSGKNQPQIPTSKSAEDLLTSPFDTPLPTSTPNVAPPPIPPNPEKDALLFALSQALTQKVRSAYTSNLAAIPAIHAQQAAMKSSLAAINNEISQLDDLQSLLSANEAILHQAMRDADKVMEDAKHRDVPGVDEVLVAPTVVAGQLYSLVADERSLEECRGVLGKALDKGKIGGDVWAKQTRSLAREEFLKKALIKKIARGMGLVDEERWE